MNDAIHRNLLATLGLLAPLLAHAADTRATKPIAVTVDWNKTMAVSKTTASLAPSFYPEMRPQSPIHDAVWSALKDLDAKFVRLQFWNLFPRLSVAELEPPTQQKTSWDFSVIDPTMIEFMDATKGREPVLQFSTVPQWMFKTDRPVRYPADSNQPAQTVEPNGYSQGTELIDSSAEQVADYYARVFSWYAKGGFTDENGQYHRSDHHYEIPWWGVLNEVQAEPEHQMTPQQYVKIYDAVVSTIRKISPTTKFVGPALAPMGRLNGKDFRNTGWPAPEPAFLQYFLDPKNHRPGIPLDMLSYHFYAMTSAGQNIESYQYSVFDQADGFLTNVALIESIRKRLSPTTRVDLDELGMFLSQDVGGPTAETPSEYWNLYAAFYAYLYMELAKIGIDVATLSEFVNSPGNQPSCSLLDPATGKPRAAFRVLKLIRDNFGPGDKLVATEYGALPLPDVEMQAFITTKGKRLLVINKRLHPVEVDLTKVGRVEGMDVVDTTSGDGPPRREGKGANGAAAASVGSIGGAAGGTLRLQPFAVAVVSIAN